MSATATGTRTGFWRAVIAMIAGAAAIGVLGFAAPARAAAPAPQILNPDFGEVTTAGTPQHWNPWNPAGTATVAVDQTAGPDGGPAVSITSTSGSTARYALTQRIAVDDSTPRKLVVSAMVKGDGLSGGLSEVRVQAFDASGKAVVPVQKGPYLTGTFGWKPVSTTIVLPAGVAQLSIEPMLDQSPGTLSVTDLTLAVDDSTGSLTATATAQGTTELAWTFADAPDADHYAVYRANGGTAPAHDAGHFVRDAYALTTADDTVQPATSYTYQVDAVTASGDVIATSPAKTVTAAASFPNTQKNTVVTALQTTNGAHVSWTTAATASADGLVLRYGNASTSVSGAQGSAEIPAAVGQTVTLLAGQTVLGSATVGSAAHPRSVLTSDAVSRIQQELASGQPTVTGSWKAMLARIDGPDSGYATNGSAGLYRARDAAFVYAVTGDASYAQTAYDGVMAAADFVAPRATNMGLELGRADLLLAPAYDWAYNGWSDAQRTAVRHLMTRAADLLSTYHHAALDDTVKTSNWVGVVRSTELALLLAARGDGDFGDNDKRIGYLTDQVAQHLDQAYTDTGYTQEGWDYFHYTELYMFPSIYFAQGTGMNVLDTHLNRPQFWNLALHVASYRAKGDVTQFGVSYQNGQVDGAFPLLFPITPASATPGLKSLYDQVEGVDSAKKPFDGIQGLWSIVYYPTTASGSPNAITAKQAKTALLDDTAGFYAFRNRYRNADDTLIATSNRNEQHRGWSAAETFSLSWIGDDTTWATLGGKDYTKPLEWSKPLVDGKLEPYVDEYGTVNGDGTTLASRAFTGQGGGYLHLDGSKNFGVTTADRQEVVDLASGTTADAITVIHDRFADAASHEWDWQLRPEAGVTIAIDQHPAAGAPAFTFTSPNGAVLSGFLLDPDGITVQNLDGTLRLSTTGTAATFSLALATSTQGALTSTTDADGRTIVDGRVIDADRLDQTPVTGLQRVASGGSDGDAPGDGGAGAGVGGTTGGAIVSGSGSPLADTGSDPIGWLATGALTVLLGAGVLIARRRRTAR